MQRLACYKCARQSQATTCQLECHTQAGHAALHAARMLLLALASWHLPAAQGGAEAAVRVWGDILAQAPLTTPGRHALQLLLAAAMHCSWLPMHVHAETACVPPQCLTNSKCIRLLHGTHHHWQCY
jgi:hypothetical protein